MPRATTSPTPNGRSTMPARGPRSGSAGGRVRVTRPKAGVPIDAKSLAKMDINSVWVEYRSGGEVVIRDFLIRRYHHIVRSIADRIRSRLPAAVDGDDLVSSGVFGLIDAINNFDPGKGVKFETFCGKRIRGAIFDNIRQMDYASRLARRREAAVSELCESFRKTYGRMPDEMELRERIEGDAEHVERVVKTARIPSHSSINSDRSSPDPDAPPINEALAEFREHSCFNSCQLRDIKEFVLRGLTPAERTVIILYYYEGLTMKEIGLALGRSESRVSQLHALIVERLRSRMAERESEFVLLDDAGRF